MTKDTHLISEFDDALSEIRRSVLTMASVTEQNFTNAMRGLVGRDADLCNSTIAEDGEVNELEMAIDHQGMDLVTRFQPVAQDLRQVLSAMKLATNLERISDEAKNIARRGRKLTNHPEAPEAKLLEPLYQHALAMLRDSARAYAEVDVELALAVRNRDPELDKMHRKLIKLLSKKIDSNTDGTMKPYLHLIFATRSLERIGDHAVNMAEDAVFVDSAVDVRHGGWDDLEEELAATDGGGEGSE